MSTITGLLRSDDAPVVDTSRTEPQDYNAGATKQNVTVFQLPNSTAGYYRNTGNVAQTVTVTAANLSANVTSVDVDLGAGLNSITLQPTEFVRPTVTMTAIRPVTPPAGQPNNEEPFNFDLTAVWS